MRQSEAHLALMRFMQQAHRSGARVVLVVTGKGGDDSAAIATEHERGVLRRLVPHWLAEPALRGLVLGFEQAARGHGGGGALYVRIRRAREFKG
jgi:DNA-nicking Smr family endonuclease